MRDSEVDGSGVTPDSGPSAAREGDFRRVAVGGVPDPGGKGPGVNSPAAWRLRTARIRAHVLRWRRRLHSTRVGRFGVKIAVALIGTLVIAVGVVLLPLPGPGWVIILGGLAILALEFHWAKRLLHFTREQLLRWTRLVREGSWLVRIVSVGGLLLVVGGALLLSLRMLA
ncbi:hypothetical protein GCM10010399_56730 [Dactylosporangium fulvum]|uniref:TIGR02611 family protein n=1 Tax=Dactylosporangium fulvum TaxID=53359 RepID=A0ABY5VSY1_9ACTN|nr:TIGR02611 family protein [Dactylosporangium fulvum]UWP80857.1 TIGR02611 family protein [Dactylosporangium fulvum]